MKNNEDVIWYQYRNFGYIMIAITLLASLRSLIIHNRAKEKHRKPLGPIPQYINKVLHTEPFSFIFHGIFWAGVLIIICPVAGTALFLVSLLRGFKKLINPREKIVDTTKNSKKELAVYVTGCDSGFGKDLAFALAAKGFVVFAGCLSDEGMKQYKGMDDKSIIPIKADVTKTEDSIDAASIVSKWLKEPSSKSSRVLHCIVNNAGVGNIGLIDWLDLSTFRKVMDVNCFGTIRTVKSFLPIFKEQVFNNTHKDARIVNVISLSGLISSTGACAYSSSKHAAEAFTSCLRLEMQAFNIPVVSVNPSWHQTPLSDSTSELLDNIWNQLTPETREEYGEEFMSSFSETFLSKRKKVWSAKLVENELVSCVELLNPPPQVLVGSDAKYSVMVMRLLPVWFQLRILNYIAPMPKAARMKQ